jgi:hypothetical protein
MRAGMKAAGVTSQEPEEDFYIGRVSYAKRATQKKDINHVGC